MYQERWDKLSRAAEKVYCGGEKGKGFVRHYFAKAIECNQFPSPQVTIEGDTATSSTTDDKTGNHKMTGV
jgi:hypothetical protein